MSNLFQVPATIEKVETMARFVRIRVDTQENMTPDEFGKIFGLRGKVGWFVFKYDDKMPEITGADIADIENLPEFNVKMFDEEKSPQQRYRAVLYCYHKQQGGKQEDFDLWYKGFMEKKIQEIKDKLV